MPYFQAYSWPGNVRELENLLERIAVYCSGMDDTVELDQPLLRNLLPELFAPTLAAAGPDPAASEPADDEIARIERVLRECNGNRSEAARRLGISRSTLWRKLTRQRP